MKRRFHINMLCGPIPTLEEIASARSEKGGYTKADLAKLGVSWPPPKGWLKELTAHAQCKTPPKTTET